LLDVMARIAVYDTGGQPLTGSFMDYLLPTTQEVPRIPLGVATLVGGQIHVSSGGH
jgi:CO/xanthine dehydrogenase Mo-binding subunit